MNNSRESYEYQRGFHEGYIEGSNKANEIATDFIKNNYKPMIVIKGKEDSELADLKKQQEEMTKTVSQLQILMTLSGRLKPTMTMNEVFDVLMSLVNEIGEQSR